VAERAAEIARLAHQGQQYGARDYVEAHVSQVAGITMRLGYGDLYVAAAWLHDVVEDTGTTRDDLARAGIPTAVVAAVDALTKRAGEGHAGYLARVAADPIAVAVKYADSSANFASTILLSPELSDGSFRDRSRRYAANIAYLTPLLPAT
jgi:(p)ppGpp synthase/HD superfamily hydrolase